MFNLKRLFLTSVYKELFSCNTSTKNGVINGYGGGEGGWVRNSYRRESYVQILVCHDHDRDHDVQ